MASSSAPRPSPSVHDYYHYHHHQKQHQHPNHHHQITLPCLVAFSLAQPAKHTVMSGLQLVIVVSGYYPLNGDDGDDDGDDGDLGIPTANDNIKLYCRGIQLPTSGPHLCQVFCLCNLHQGYFSMFPHKGSCPSSSWQSTCRPPWLSLSRGSRSGSTTRRSLPGSPWGSPPS